MLVEHRKRMQPLNCLYICPFTDFLPVHWFTHGIRFTQCVGVDDLLWISALFKWQTLIDSDQVVFRMSQAIPGKVAHFLWQNYYLGKLIFSPDYKHIWVASWLLVSNRSQTGFSYVKCPSFFLFLGGMHYILWMTSPPYIFLQKWNLCMILSSFIFLFFFHPRHKLASKFYFLLQCRKILVGECFRV